MFPTPYETIIAKWHQRLAPWYVRMTERVGQQGAGTVNVGEIVPLGFELEDRKFRFYVFMRSTGHRLYVRSGQFQVLLWCYRG